MEEQEERDTEESQIYNYGEVIEIETQQLREERGRDREEMRGKQEKGFGFQIATSELLILDN